MSTARELLDECFYHGEEPLPEEYYRLCDECGHCWPSRAEFLRDVQQAVYEIELRGARASDEYVCPLCAHSF